MSITTANTTALPVPADLPADREALMRALRMPHARAIAPEVLATARAQRWEPVETVKALLVEETAGRDGFATTTTNTATADDDGDGEAVDDEKEKEIR